MMLSSNIKMANQALKNAKWRSFLTMLGVIIGVMSVITTVSLGEGIKQQIVGQINNLGPDLITVRAGKAVNRDKAGNITSVNLLNALGGQTLNESDLDVVRKTDGVRVAVPLGIITGVAQADDREFQNGFIVATTDGMPEILNQRVEFGEFFAAADPPKDSVIIGKRVAEELFLDNVPIGRTLRIREQNFVVKGVFEEFPNSPLSPNTDYNRAIFIPYEMGKQLSGGNPQIAQVLAKPNEPKNTKGVAAAIRKNILAAHAGQEDFTVLRQDENLAVASNLLSLITNMIAGIAAISLLVGGIGIMNIMLVSVTERTHEIGIRKAIGATNPQILGQFLIESLMLSFTGGIIGVLLSILANYFIRIFTDLQPVITLPIIFISVIVSVVVGVIFGVTPALRAARKDPITALRQV
jgi:putative ABC transport system permease protein